MKNNKQTKLNKKRTGLYIGLGLGLASIVAGATTGLAVALTKSNDSEPLNGKVKFIAGSNHTFKSSGSSLTINLKSATQLIQILPKDTIVTSNAETAASDFVGWAKTSDFSHGKIDASKVLSATSYVEPATSLTAVYKNNVTATGDWHTIKFSKGDEKVILTGNTIINVLENTLFQEINKPGCESQAAGSEQKCIGWKNKSTGTTILDTDKITTNLEIVPIMSEAAVVTFAPTVADIAAGAVISGTSVVTAKLGSTFDKINIPKADYSGCSDYKRIFVGWYKQESTDWPEADKYTPTTSLNGKVNAIARSVAETDANFIKFHAVQPKTGSVVYQGNTDFAVDNGKKWGSFNLPTPVAAEMKVSGWQFACSKTATTWTDLSTGQEFTDGSNVYIRPVLTSSITTVRIVTEKTPYIAPACKAKLYAEVLPKESTQTVTWKIFEDSEGKIQITDPDIAYIQDDGTIWISEGYSLIKDDIYVQATSTVAPISSPVTKITINLPTRDNASYWTYDEKDFKWYRIENIFDTTKDIDFYEMNAQSKTKSIARTEFDAPIYIGDKVTFIDKNFLYGCTKFNNKIAPQGTIDTIEDNFLFGCSSFNQKGIGEFVKPIKYIGDNFMNGCTAYDNDGSLEPINFQSIITIGNDLCKGMTAFNSPIKFGNNLESIGTGFMDGCTSFNNGDNGTNLILPSSLTSVGGKFMHKCANFTGIIQLDYENNVFPTGAEVTSLSSTDANHPIAKDGFKVIGNGASSFPFKTISGLGGYYRKVNVDATKVISVEFDTEKSASYTSHYNVGDTFTSENIVLKATVQDETYTETTIDVTTGFQVCMDGVEIPKDYKFTDEDQGGPYYLTATYCGKTTTNSLPITVGNVTPSSYGKPISHDKFFEIYETYEGNFKTLISNSGASLPTDVTLTNLWNKDPTQKMPKACSFSVISPLKDQIESEDYAPSHGGYLSLKLQFSGGSEATLEDTINYAVETLVKSASYYYDDTNKTITVKIGEESSEDTYFVCTFNSDGFITHLNKNFGDGSEECNGFDAIYSHNANKRVFMEEYQIAYNNIQPIVKGKYKSVNFKDGSYLKRKDDVEATSLTSANIVYDKIIQGFGQDIPQISVEVNNNETFTVPAGQISIDDLFANIIDFLTLGHKLNDRNTYFDLSFSDDKLFHIDWYYITEENGEELLESYTLGADTLLVDYDRYVNITFGRAARIHFEINNWNESK